MLGESGSAAELDISLDVRRLWPDSRVRALVPTRALIRLAAAGGSSGQLGTSAHDGAGKDLLLFTSPRAKTGLGLF